MGPKKRKQMQDATLINVRALKKALKKLEVRAGHLEFLVHQHTKLLSSLFELLKGKFEAPRSNKGK